MPASGARPTLPRKQFRAKPDKYAPLFDLKIYTTFDERRPLVLRLWVASWKARGWEPRVLLPAEKIPPGQKHCPCDWINFGFFSDGQLRAKLAGARGWSTAKIVKFSYTTTDEDIFAWGRPLGI